MPVSEQPPSKMRVSRALAIWLSSFLIVASLLVVYAGLPLGPLVIAGGLTLLLTVVRHYWGKRARVFH